MLKNVVIEENSPNRFQVQVFENTLALILSLMVSGLLIAAYFNFRTADGEGVLLCLLIALVLAGVFAYFVGVRRLTIDRDANTVHMTTRTLIREKVQSLPLSEVSAVFFRRNSEGHVVDVPPDEDHKHRWIYGFGFVMKDGAEHAFYNLKGRHVYDTGRALQAWIETHAVLTAPAETQ